MYCYSQAGAALIRQFPVNLNLQRHLWSLSQSLAGFPSWLGKHQKNCNADSNLSLPVSPSAYWVHTTACFLQLKGIFPHNTWRHNVKWTGWGWGRPGVSLFVTQMSANGGLGLLGSLTRTFMRVPKLMSAGLMLSNQEKQFSVEELWSVQQLLSAIYSVHHNGTQVTSVGEGNMDWKFWVTDIQHCSLPRHICMQGW